ncbi:MAG: prenyltransferase [candidate division WOR-3 bacterium]|nr:MAG: prenyltransferase [candidate division WOR-3 bacterium]
MTTQDIKAWIALSRPPFHSVGVLPYILGGVVAWRMAEVFYWSVFFIGTVGVIFIMLATYYAGEYWDFREDSLSKGSRFAGGSQVLQKRLLSRHTALVASIVSIGCAVVVGIVLQFFLHTGPWTLAFGLLGILGGFFYSTRPIRWVGTGFGEVWIAFCYGWLPVAVGYYLQTGTLNPYIHIISVPIGLTIFNVILLDEYPDREADRSAQKMNMLARIGPQTGVYLYAGVALLSWVAFGFSLYQGIDPRAGILYMPVLIASLVVVWNMVKKRWEDERVLERLCGVNILINLATTAVFLVAYLWLEVK